MAEIYKKGSKYYARSTYQIHGVPENNFEHILRGIYNCSIESSLIIDVKDICEVYLSVFSKDRAMEKVEHQIKSREQSLESLMSGWKFENGKLSNHKDKKYSGLIFILGRPEPVNNSQLTRLIISLISVKIPATLILNIHPVKIIPNSKIDIYINKNRNISKDNKQRIINIHKDSCFWACFSIFLQDEDYEVLQRHLEAVISNIGSVYDSEVSELQIFVKWHKKALKYARRLYQGEMLYGTLLPIRELLAYFQIPLTYGVREVKPVSFDIPAISTSGIDIGKALGNFNEELFPVYLDPDSLFEHIVIWGATGTGKSTFIKNSIINLHNQVGLRLLIFDLHNEYREIINELKGKPLEDIMIVNPFINPFSINLFELPDQDDIDREIAIIERTENFISMINQMFILGEVQESRLRETILQMYTENKLTIGDLIRKLNYFKSRALASKLKKFTHGFYGQIFNQSSSTLSFEKIEKATTIIELGRLPAELRYFFIQVFLILWWDYRRAQKDIQPHLLVLDEFTNYAGLNVIRKMLSEARKFRQGLICACQGPNQISDIGLLEDVIRNTATKLVFRQDQATDKRTVATGFGGLEKDQYHHLSLLETGEAIVKLKNTNSVFRIRTYPMPELSKPEDRYFMNFIPKSEFKSIISTSLGIDNETSAPDYDIEFLKIVSEKSPVSTIEVVSELQIQKKRGFEIKDKLKSDGLILEEEIRKGRGRPRIILKLSDAGNNILGIKKKSAAPQYGKEEHNQMKEKVAEILMNAGWEVKIEYNGCDVVAMNENYKIAVEVETGKHKGGYDQILRNIERDNEWADHIFLICPNRKAIQNVIKNTSNFNNIDIQILSYQQINQLSDLIPKEFKSS